MKEQGRGTNAQSVSFEVPGWREMRRQERASIWSRVRFTEGRSGRERWEDSWTMSTPTSTTTKSSSAPLVTHKKMTVQLKHEGIRIESRASAAWSVLAQCYGNMNESQKALQLKIMQSIMAYRLWHDAEEWDPLADSQSMNLLAPNTWNIYL